jgi:pyruvate-formate lyase-activating enzyme
MKARVYNQIRKDLYKKRLDQIKEKEKIEFFDKVFQLNHETHWELINYHTKRKDKAELLQKRQAAPQTKSMKKKLGLIKKVPKINLESSK